MSDNTLGIKRTSETSTTFVAYNTRLLFAQSLFKGLAVSNNTKLKFDVTFIIDKKEVGQDISTLLEVAQAVCDDKFTATYKKCNSFVNSLDGDQQKNSAGELSDKPLKHALGHYILPCRYLLDIKETPRMVPLYSPNNTNLVECVADGRLKESALREMFYSGCYVDIVFAVSAYSYSVRDRDTGQTHKGNCCRLFVQNIRWRADGEKLARASIESLKQTVDEDDDPFVKLMQGDQLVAQKQHELDQQEAPFTDVPF